MHSIFLIIHQVRVWFFELHVAALLLERLKEKQDKATVNIERPPPGGCRASAQMEAEPGCVTGRWRCRLSSSDG